MRAVRVLVVDDDSLIAMLLAELLEEMGYEVCATANTEAGAVATAARCSPDLMIVDARLGNGSGVAAVQEILRTGFVPHVFASGNTKKAKSLDPRAVVIQKPFLESDLARAIERALSNALAY